MNIYAKLMLEEGLLSGLGSCLMLINGRDKHADKANAFTGKGHPDRE